MIITHLELKNWRNCGEMSFDPYIYGAEIGGFHVLDLLEGFHFLYFVAIPIGGGLQYALSFKGIREIYGRTANQDRDIFILMRLTESQDPDATNWSYELAFKLDRNNRKKQLLVTHERVTRNNEELFCRPDSNDLLDEERLTQTFLEQVNENAKFRALAKFFASESYYLNILKLWKLFGPSTKYTIRRRKKGIINPGYLLD
jgi:hypothetical protein